MTVDREPDFIHPSEHVCEIDPEYGIGIEGGSDSDNYRSDSWYVDRQFYRLTTMRVWKDAQAISGLEVKYVPPLGYKGWPDYIKMYGYEHLQPADVDPTQISFTKDLEYIEICVDQHLLGFRFKEYDEDDVKSLVTETVVDNVCPGKKGWQKIHLKTDPDTGEPL